MFLTFLNKEDRHILDLSAFINYSPEQLLFYYYDSWINITLDTYLQMHEWLENGYGNRNNLNRWLELIDNDIEAGADISMLRDSEFLNTIGPYYYQPTGTQFHFSRFYAIEHEPLTSIDFAKLYNLHKIPTVDKDLHKYNQSRKVGKRPTRTKDELIRDLNMCTAALKHIDNMNKHLIYLNLFIEGRKAVIEEKELFPPQASLVPDKPIKPEAQKSKLKLLHSMGIARQQQLDNDKIQRDYNRNMKIYFIRCREYDRACERYKNALHNWNENRKALVKRCQTDIKDALVQVHEARTYLAFYQEIIRRSNIHSDYQRIETLQNFKRYLETGRADDLQGCMNIYEGEKHWNDIKASQERIENTIHFLHSDPDAFEIANQEANRLIASTLD